MNACDQQEARNAAHPAATLAIILACYFMILPTPTWPGSST